MLTVAVNSCLLLLLLFLLSSLCVDDLVEFVIAWLAEVGCGCYFVASGAFILFVVLAVGDGSGSGGGDGAESSGSYFGCFCCCC